MIEHEGEKRSNLHLDNTVLMWLVGGGTIALAFFQLFGQQVAWLLLLSGVAILVIAIRQGNPQLDNIVLMWLVGGGIVALVLLQLFHWPITWLLLLSGTIIFIFATRQAWLDPQRWQTLKQWMYQVDSRRSGAILGGLLLLTGLMIRFGPRDIGLALSIVGLVLLAGGIWFLVRTHSPIVVSHPTLAVAGTDVDDETKPEFDGYAKLSQEFRLRVSETVFRNAQTTSLMNFIIGLTFFIVGIGLFILLAYGVFQLQSTESSSGNEDQLSQIFAQELVSRLNTLQGQSFDEILIQLSPLLLLILRDISARQLVPIVSLIIIAWIGSRLVFNAIRLSQRRVIRETLEELGPLQDTLAGIPPRKPFMQVAEQSLRHTRRAFTFRLWLSIILGIVGISLLIVTAIRGLQPGANDWITTATVGASGVISFVVSLITTRQKEIGENLLQVVREETRVAQDAQRSEIVELYVAQLLRGARPQQLEGVLDILHRLHEPLPGKTHSNGNNVSEAEISEQQNEQS